MPLPCQASPPAASLDGRICQTPSCDVHPPLPWPSSHPELSHQVTLGIRSTTPLMMFLGQAASLRPSISTAKPTRLPCVTTPLPHWAGSVFSESSDVSLSSAQPGS